MYVYIYICCSIPNISLAFGLAGVFFLGGGIERTVRGELICDNWECLDLSAQDSIVIYAKFLSLAR